ncbi:hypothetical protein BJ165DRAFT_1522514 [Panaeolus papilionaceus]|nr:hypothetical protein BJ165DRAFT_1522514 [Panaeolus papilionaceus]
MASRGGFAALFCAHPAASLARSVMTAELYVFSSSKPENVLHDIEINSSSLVPSRRLLSPLLFGVRILIIGISVDQHSAQGSGAVASPLVPVCQAMVAIGIPRFKFYYGSLIFSGLNVIFLVMTFKATLLEFTWDRSGEWEPSPLASPPESSGRPPNVMFDKTNTIPHSLAGFSALRLALCLSYQWAIMIFALLYCGCEAATQSFNADPNTSGYVRSGFRAGITVGRLIFAPVRFLEVTNILGLPMPNENGSWRLVCVCLILSKASYLDIDISSPSGIGLVLQITIWVVNSSIANALAASAIGALHGPPFAAYLTLANDLLSAEVSMVSMALISAFASVGAAVFPFVAGTVASSKGIHTITYVTTPLVASILISGRIPVENIEPQKYGVVLPLCAKPENVAYAQLVFHVCI